MAFPYNPHVPGVGVPCGPCGSPGNQFPYTVQHDANLNYICETVAKAMQEQMATNEAFQALDADFGELVTYVNNYLDGLDVPAEVGKWMDRFVDGGGMADLVHDTLTQFGYIYPDYGETSRDQLLSVALQWLACDVNTRCVATSGGAVQFPCLFSYSQTKTYREYTSADRTFVGTDTARPTVTSLKRFPVVYLDCSAFVNLATRGIYPNQSLNFHAVNGDDLTPDNISDEPGLSYILENPELPWTFDFLGRANTYQMARLFDMSGNPLALIGRRPARGIPSWTPARSSLQPGDILFKGHPGSGTYKGISHVGIYMADTTLINPPGMPGWEFKTYNGKTDFNGGYILECTGGDTTGEYKDVVRIITMDTWLSDNEETYVYSAKPRTNIMVSNKARSAYAMEILCKDRTYYVDKRGNVLGQKNNATLDEYFGNVRVKGLTIPSSGMNIDQVDYGTWQATLHDTINACTGHWPGGWSMASAESIVIQQTGGAASGYGRLQLLWANFGASDTRMAFRMRTPGAQWSKWAIVMTE